MKSVAKNSQKTCKFPADIARAWGCRVYAPRMTGKLKKQLEPVIAAAARPDFPKKEKSRYQMASIIEFGRQFVTLSKDKRKITVKEPDHQDIKPPSGEMPQQPNPPGDGDLFLKLSPEELAELKKKRLDYLEDIYLHPGQRLAPSGGSYLRLSNREEDELRAERPWLFKRHEKESYSDNDANSRTPRGFRRTRAAWKSSARFTRHAGRSSGSRRVRSKSSTGRTARASAPTNR